MNPPMDDDFGYSSADSHCVAGGYRMGRNFGCGSAREARIVVGGPKFIARTTGQQARLDPARHRPELTVARKRRRAR
jgi:hypothetical protein